MKNKLWEFFKTGLKLWVVSILAGLVFWLFSAIFGISVLALLAGNVTGLSVLMLILYIVLSIPLAILIAGIVAAKLWKWD